jgi:hypothetical protein
MTETLVKPSRRFLRFSLRTMFVLVTLTACWLGWQAKIVADRKSAMKIHGMGFEPDCWGPNLGIVRTWMGDYPIREFFIWDDQVTPADAAHIRAVFPEASIEIMHLRPDSDSATEMQSAPPPPPMKDLPANQADRP